MSLQGTLTKLLCHFRYPKHHTTVCISRKILWLENQSILVTKLAARIKLSFFGHALNSRALNDTVGVTDEDATVNN